MLTLDMITDFLEDNPHLANHQLRRTRGATKNFIRNFKLVYKHHKENKIVYDFNGEEHSIHVETEKEEDRIVQISCGKGELVDMNN